MEEIRDRVLDRARIEPSDTVVDVGAGTGLLAFGAADRLDVGWIIALDMSVDCLEELLSLAQESGRSGIMYMLGDAVVLPLPDACADVAVTRSVLMYVDDTAEAARELHRVLRPGGRISLFEPVNREGTFIATAVDWSPLGGDLAWRVGEEWERYAAATPLLRFDDVQLVEELEGAGFEELDVLVEDVGEEWVVTEESVDVRLEAVGAPGEPSLRARWGEAFRAAEVDALVGHLKSLAGTTIEFRRRAVFVAARKP